MFACNYTGLANLNQSNSGVFLPAYRSKAVERLSGKGLKLRCTGYQKWNYLTDSSPVLLLLLWLCLVNSSIYEGFPEKNDTLTELVFPVRSNGAGGHRKFFQAPDKKSQELQKYYLLYIRVVPATEKQPRHYEKRKKKATLKFSIVLLQFQLTLLSLQWLWLVDHILRY